MTELLDPQKINLADFAIAADVLGPGRRALVWVQGCPRRCYHCITPHMQDLKQVREIVTVDDLAQRILLQLPLEGITFLGGEPFAHAQALAALVRTLRSTTDLSVVTYTGYTLTQLHEANNPAWDALLAVSDILIDGEYIEAQACDLLWRGSANQQLHFLTPRYAALAPLVQNARGRLLEFSLDRQGRLRVIGIPEPDFFVRLQSNLAAHEVSLHMDDEFSGQKVRQ